MNKSVIKTESLNIWYKHLHAIKDVNMEIPENNITALIGASGSGKSTFLRSLNRMLDIIPVAKVEGFIYFEEKNILDEQTDVIELRRKIGMVFQNPTPFPKSIFDNIAYGLEIQGLQKSTDNDFFQLFRKIKIDPAKLEKSGNEIDKTVVHSLKNAVLWDEVKDRLHQSALRLSGGQQQRLCIARMIAVKPEILLFDEPCSALDPISTRKIENLLLGLKKHYTIIIVTHNMSQAKRISDYVGFFHLGNLIEFGKTKKIFENPDKELTKDYIHGDFG